MSPNFKKPSAERRLFTIATVATNIFPGAGVRAGDRGGILVGVAACVTWSERTSVNDPPSISATRSRRDSRFFLFEKAPQK